MTVESEPGAGRRVYDAFSCGAERRAKLRLATPVAEGDAGRETILLVEDEGACAIVSAVLRRQGYHVLEASTPHAAFEKFEPARPASICC